MMKATGSIKAQVDRFHDIVLELTGNPDIALEAGRFAPFAKASGAMSHYVSGFITPEAAYSVIGKLYHQVSRACLLETRSLKKNQVEITVKPKPDVEEKPYQCENRKGSFEAISKLLTGKFAHIDHPVCCIRGETVVSTSSVGNRPGPPFGNGSAITPRSFQCFCGSS